MNVARHVRTIASVRIAGMGNIRVNIRARNARVVRTVASVGIARHVQKIMRTIPHGVGNAIAAKTHASVTA